LEKSALILGIAGQNGRLLTEFLLQQDYRVTGFGWKDSLENSETLRPFRDRIEFSYGDLRDDNSLTAVLQSNAFTEIYNFAAQSQPGLSWQAAVETGEVNAIGAHRLFEAARRLQPAARIFQASSSDMFGNATESPQNEQTPLRPANPYSVSKAYAHQIAATYRVQHGSFIACGILFNHESRYRDIAFLSQKLTYGAACAKLGIVNSPLLNEKGEPIVRDGKLAMGNLDARRDWGYAGDYVRAMWLMLQQPKADDFVIGTGVSRSVRDMCAAAYAAAGLDWQEHVVTDPRFLRPADTADSVADASKAGKKLGWAPQVGFEAMLADMVAAHIERLKKAGAAGAA
jgi:GDPmannose 4,6-dehydratase